MDLQPLNPRTEVLSAPRGEAPTPQVGPKTSTPGLAVAGARSYPGAFGRWNSYSCHFGTPGHRATSLKTATGFPRGHTWTVGVHPSVECQPTGP